MLSDVVEGKTLPVMEHRSRHHDVIGGLRSGWGQCPLLARPSRPGHRLGLYRDGGFYVSIGWGSGHSLLLGCGMPALCGQQAVGGVHETGGSVVPHWVNVFL